MLYLGSSSSSCIRGPCFLLSQGHVMLLADPAVSVWGRFKTRLSVSEPRRRIFATIPARRRWQRGSCRRRPLPDKPPQRLRTRRGPLPDRAPQGLRTGSRGRREIEHLGSSRRGRARVLQGQVRGSKPRVQGPRAKRPLPTCTYPGPCRAPRSLGAQEPRPRPTEARG